MQSIYLVACVSQKQNHPAPAELMYQSDWFLKAREYVKRYADNWYILSAKYGLLAPETVIEPYNKTLAHGMSKAERLNWANSVYADLLQVTKPEDKLVFLAGQKYRENLIPKLELMRYSLEIPMEGLRIGNQLAWLKAQLEKEN
jgi:cytoplasmic iron level regulating protein YaaA (DUF328/UPF0246 family)